MLYFIYNDDIVIRFYLNNVPYFYVKNTQNGILAVVDENNNIVSSYEYNNWGSIVSVRDVLGNEITDYTHIGHINPFRYRSYYYDIETGLYYLNNRYYNPQWKRFLNADSYVSTGTGLLSHNMYMYCNNNSINIEDSNGNLPKWITNIERFLIKTTATVTEWLGLSHSSTLLKHSLQDNPEDLKYGNNSKIVKDIKQSSEFKSAIDTIAFNNANNTLNNYYQNLRFNSLDLKLGLQNTSMYVSGTLTNGKGNLSITIKDIYDFKYEKYSKAPIKRWPLNAINNVAWVDQQMGIINPYDIIIKFDYCVNCP